jgi:hypothetical protein
MTIQAKVSPVIITTRTPDRKIILDWGRDRSENKEDVFEQKKREFFEIKA